MRPVAFVARPSSEIDERSKVEEPSSPVADILLVS
jgi:hypothetical protein